MESVVGRFAPTPSGRMHAGNLLTAMLAWLSARKQDGEFVLRIEDLDEERCRFGENSQILMDDLRWFGIDWDRGGTSDSFQSRRFPIYKQYFDKLSDMGLIYPCYCSRAALHAATAPHGSDGQVLYDGRCRKLFLSGGTPPAGRVPAYRVTVPDEEIVFRDGVQGEYRENLARDCTDFLVRRADGVYAYQLAVVVDDALSGVTEVVRGRDLLSSTPRQIWLYRLFGFPEPTFYHIPLLLSANGKRLSKRDGDTDVGAMRERYRSPEPIIGRLAAAVGLIDRPEPLTLSELLPEFDWAKLPREDVRFAEERQT